MNIKEKGFKILNGMSLGIVIALVPAAMFNKIAEVLGFTNLLTFFSISTSLMCLLIGFCIALQFKFDPISSASLAVATMIAGGAIRVVDGALVLNGSGDILNSAIGATLAVAIILLLQDKLKTYKLLVLPLLVIIVVGSITQLTLAPVSQITKAIGVIINNFTLLQPFIMVVLIALSFALLIVSPISTVAIAVAIELGGGASAAANIGVTAVAISLAILSFSSNGLGTSLAHILGSPKIQMANFVKKPIMLLPGLLSAVIASIFVPILHLAGTKMSAGFGLTGLIGPLGHLEIVGVSTSSVIAAVIGFIIIPTITSFISIYIIKNKLGLVKDEYYRLNIN